VDYTWDWTKQESALGETPPIRLRRIGGATNHLQHCSNTKNLAESVRGASKRSVAELGGVSANVDYTWDWTKQESALGETPPIRLRRIGGATNDLQHCSNTKNLAESVRGASKRSVAELGGVSANVDYTWDSTKQESTL